MNSQRRSSVGESGNRIFVAAVLMACAAGLAFHAAAASAVSNGAPALIAVGKGAHLSGALRHALRTSRRLSSTSVSALGEDQRRRAVGGLARHLMIDPSDARPRVTFKAVLATGSDAEVAALASAGARVRGHVGRVVSFDALLDDAESFARVPSVRMLDIAKRMKPELDVSGPEIGADTVRDPVHGFDATGSGVLVAAMDTGHDVKHLDFRNADRTTRFQSVLNMDYRCRGPHLPGHPDSCYFDETRINKYLKGLVGMNYTDPAATLGHGSHVLGIAAGSGQATGNGFPPFTYVGIAPEADLIGVKIFDNLGYQIGDITEALQFLVEEQDRLGNPPLVVNMSFGHQFGAHDGSDPDEIAIDDLIEEGIFTGATRVIVKSAGNSGGEPIYIGNTAQVGVGKFHAFTIPSTYQTASGGTASCGTLRGSGNDMFLVDMWYEGSDDITVRLIAPDGTYFENGTGNDPNLAALDTPSGTIFVDCPSEPNPTNEDRECVLGVDDSAGVAPATGTWTLRVTGNSLPSGGDYDAWIAAASRGRCAWGWDDPSPGNSISIPGTAFKVITVGAHITKTEWVNVARREYGYQDPSFVIGDIMPFSSEGPTRDGRLKPEIAAPGMGIVSVRARTVSTASGTVGRQRTVQDGKHMIQEGTSMSSPHVAGAAALLLSLDPGLDTDDIRALLMDNAAVDIYTGGVPNAMWGMGKLDVLAAASSAKAGRRNGTPAP